MGCGCEGGGALSVGVERGGAVSMGVKGEKQCVCIYICRRM